MTIHVKIRKIREEKNISQESIAYELDMNQSQYSRRESGEICFVVNDIIKIARILNVPIYILFAEEGKNNDFSGNLGIPEHNIITNKLIEQYEKRIEDKDNIINLLKNDILKR